MSISLLAKVFLLIKIVATAGSLNSGHFAGNVGRSEKKVEQIEICLINRHFLDVGREIGFPISGSVMEVRQYGIGARGIVRKWLHRRLGPRGQVICRSTDGSTNSRQAEYAIEPDSSHCLGFVSCSLDTDS